MRVDGNIIMEVHGTFALTVGLSGAALPLKTLPRCRYWYQRTVERALSQHPNAWPRARKYVLRQVERIAAHAAADAILANDGDISPTILDAAVYMIVRDQQPFCARLMRRKGKGGLEVVGVFCADV